MSYRIKTVAEMTGIARNTLIAWERRHGLVVPTRAPNGYRVYSDADVQRLYELRALLEEGFKVSEAVCILQERGESTGPVAPGKDSGDGRLTEELVAEEILAHLLAFDQHEAARCVSRLSLVPYEDQLDRIWFPILREVGEGWADCRVSVIQEHFVTAFCMARLRGILLAVQGAVGGPRHVVCAGAQGERHELGIMGLAIRLSIRGWRVTYLGADAPTADLGRFLAEQLPDAVCLSVVCKRSVDEVLALARELRAAVPEAVKLVVGGHGVPADMREEAVPQVRWYRQSRELLSSDWFPSTPVGPSLG